MTVRYLLLNSLTRKAVAELPASSCRFGDTLNAPGSFELTMPLDPGAGITASDLRSPTAVVAIERDDVLLWAGFVWTWEADLDGQTITLRGMGYHSYLQRRRWPSFMFTTFSDTEQASIARGLIETAQDLGPGTYAGIDTSSTTSTGITRDRFYPGYQRKTFAQLIEELSGSNTLNGLDFAYLPRWEAGPNSTMVVDFYVHSEVNYGRDSGLVFDIGTNASVRGFTSDASAQRFLQITVGAGEEEQAPFVNLELDGFDGDTTLLLEELDSFTEVSNVLTLLDHAEHLLSIHRNPIDVPTIAVPSSYLGQFIVGDRVTARAEFGLVTFADQYRITEWSADFTAGSPEVVSLTLAPLELFLP